MEKIQVFRLIDSLAASHDGVIYDDAFSATDDAYGLLKSTPLETERKITIEAHAMNKEDWDKMEEVK